MGINHQRNIAHAAIRRGVGRNRIPLKGESNKLPPEISVFQQCGASDRTPAANLSAYIELTWDPVELILPH
jgi:hypothetical protein